jgi:hypothetical protein
MGSVAKRRCARGQNCYHVRQLGLPEPIALRMSFPGDICEKCREADQQRGVGSIEQDRSKARDYQRLETRASTDIRVFKQDLVLKLFTQRGSFWEAMQELRLRWDIKPSTHLPPKHLVLPLPPPSLAEQLDNIRTEEKRQELEKVDERWGDDLLSIILEFVPERFRERHGLDSFFDWNGFVSACVLYDPPETNLREFSELGGPRAKGLWIETADDHENSYAMVASPIRRFADPVEIRRVETEYWTALLDKLEELYLQPLGLVLADMLEDVRQRFPDIRLSRIEKPNRLKKRRYIEVDEHTTEDDVRKAFRMLAEAHQTRPAASRPQRDKLTCVEAAVLHDRRKWTYEQLADRYGWSDSTLASKYIRDGRRILQQ